MSEGLFTPLAGAGAARSRRGTATVFRGLAFLFGHEDEIITVTWYPPRLEAFRTSGMGVGKACAGVGTGWGNPLEGDAGLPWPLTPGDRSAERPLGPPGGEPPQGVCGRAAPPSALSPASASVSGLLHCIVTCFLKIISQVFWK